MGEKMINVLAENEQLNKKLRLKAKEKRSASVHINEEDLPQVGKKRKVFLFKNGGRKRSKSIKVDINEE